MIKHILTLSLITISLFALKSSLLLEGDREAKAGNLNRAQKLWINAIEDIERDYNSIISRMRRYNMFDGQLYIYKMLLKKSPSPQLYYRIVSLLSIKARHREAIELIIKLAVDYPDSASSILARYIEKNLDSKEIFMDRLYKKYKNDKRNKTIWARLILDGLYVSEDYKRFVYYQREFAHIYFSSYVANNVALLLLVKGHYNLAVKLYNSYPYKYRDDRFYNNLADAYIKILKPDKAIKIASNIRSITKDKIIAIALIQKGKYKEAYRHILKYIKADKYHDKKAILIAISLMYANGIDFNAIIHRLQPDMHDYVKLAYNIARGKHNSDMLGFVKSHINTPARFVSLLPYIKGLDSESKRYAFYYLIAPDIFLYMLKVSTLNDPLFYMLSSIVVFSRIHIPDHIANLILSYNTDNKFLKERLIYLKAYIYGYYKNKPNKAKALYIKLFKSYPYSICYKKAFREYKSLFEKNR